MVVTFGTERSAVVFSFSELAIPSSLCSALVEAVNKSTGLALFFSSLIPPLSLSSPLPSNFLRLTQALFLCFLLLPFSFLFGSSLPLVHSSTSLHLQFCFSLPLSAKNATFLKGGI
ncbi:hypothetical protein QOT17_025317 [Balamuthia mandrillaris]